MEIYDQDKIFRFQEFCKLGTVKDEKFSMQLKMYSLYLEGVEHGGRYALSAELGSISLMTKGFEKLIEKIESYQVRAVCNIDAEKFKNWIENCEYIKDDKKSEEEVIKIWFSFLDELNKPDNLERNEQ